MDLQQDEKLDEKLRIRVVKGDAEYSKIVLKNTKSRLDQVAMIHKFKADGLEETTSARLRLL